MLEAYAENQKVGKQFWLALRDAAARMELLDRARRYEKYAEGPLAIWTVTAFIRGYD